MKLDLTRFSQGQKVALGILGFLGLFGIVGGLGEVMKGRPEGLITVIFWPAILVAAYYFMDSSNKQKSQFQASGGIETVLVGNYLAGLPNVNYRIEAMECAIYQDRFAFLARKTEIDSIPRDAVNQILVDSKSQITQRLTATRMLALGVFSLAAPKKQRSQEFCLVIDWDSEDGTRQNTVFDFLSQNGSSLANQAANTLKRYAKPKVDRLKANEKKCPHCAEIIKIEARICKHCHSSVE